MRRKTTRPTLIYWLIDTRPETIAAGYHVGYPFYCGKTIVAERTRLLAHIANTKHYPERLISKYIARCGGHIRMQLLETVPAGNNWQIRERHWIALTRFSFPDNANTSSGGEGVPGMVHGPEARARQSKAASNRTKEHRHKLGASMRGKTHSVETRERLRQANLAREFSPEKKAEISRKISLAKTGKKLSAEHCVKMSEHRRGKSLSVAHRAKLSEVQKGKIISVEQRKKISASLIGHAVTKETLAKISATKAAKREAARHA